MEYGVEDAPQGASQSGDYSPTDLIELNKDFFQPSATYSDFFSAVQKDMTLGNIDPSDIPAIELRFGNIEDAALLLAKNKDRWGALQSTINYYLAWIALRISLGRGRNGFTARLMRSTFGEQHNTMRHLEGLEKRKEGIMARAKRFVGI